MALLLPTEQKVLERLFAAVLQDRQLQARLLCHDSNLQPEFCISNRLWQQLCKIQAANLEDFCRQLESITHAEN
jgi:hypothetical protein